MQPSLTFTGSNNCSTDSHTNSSNSHVSTGPVVDLLGGSTMDLLNTDHLHSQQQNILKTSNCLQPFSPNSSSPAATNNDYSRRISFPQPTTNQMPHPSQRCFDAINDLSMMNSSMESNTAAAYAMMPSAFQCFRGGAGVVGGIGINYQPNVFMSTSDSPAMSFHDDSANPGASGSMISAFDGGSMSTQKMFEGSTGTQTAAVVVSTTDTSMVSPIDGFRPHSTTRYTA